MGQHGRDDETGHGGAAAGARRQWLASDLRQVRHGRTFIAGRLQLRWPWPARRHEIWRA